MPSYYWIVWVLTIWLGLILDHRFKQWMMAGAEEQQAIKLWFMDMLEFVHPAYTPSLQISGGESRKSVW